MEAPSGSSTPVFALVPSTTVDTSFGLNWGSEKTQSAFSSLILVLNSLILFTPGTTSGDTVIEPTAFNPNLSSKYW